MAVTYLGDNNPDGQCVGLTSTELVGFHGATPTAQSSGSAGTTLSVTYTASNGFGFTTSAEMESVLAQLDYIVHVLNEKGLIAGS
jgi:hypothetical protein